MNLEALTLTRQVLKKSHGKWCPSWPQWILKQIGFIFIAHRKMESNANVGVNNVSIMNVLMATFDRHKYNVPLRSVNRWNVVPQLLTSEFVELSLFMQCYYAVACCNVTECLLQCQLILLGSSLSLCRSFPFATTQPAELLTYTYWQKLQNDKKEFSS